MRFRDIVPLLFFIFFWEIVADIGVVNISLFPPPSRVWTSMVELYLSGEMLRHCGVSLERVVFGLALGIFAGTVVGLSTGRCKGIDMSVTPLIQVFRSFPPVAIIPFVILWLGIGEAAKISAIGFAVFFPVWLNTHIGSSKIPLQYLQACSTLTRSSYKRLTRVILPACAPFIVAGVRNGISIAYIMVFVSELAGASSGIGYLISTSHLAYRIDKMTAGLLLLGLLGAASDRVFTAFIERSFPWIRRI